MMPDVWCAIPVYNNAPTIADIAKRTHAILSNVIVVDDGSTDADLRTLLSDFDVRVIRHPKNLGKGAALRTAFQFASDHNAKYLVTLDGDGQHFPEDIPLFLPHLQPYTILIGNRAHVTGPMPRSSKFGREFSDFWIFTETGHDARDTQCGFRAYPVAPVLQLNLNSTGYHFEMEVITRGIWAGLTTASIPIRVQYWEAEQGQSSFDPLLDNLKIARLHAHLIARQLLPFPHNRIVISEPDPLTGDKGGQVPLFSLTPSPGTPGEGWGEGRSLVDTEPVSSDNRGDMPSPPALCRSTGRGSKASLALTFATFLSLFIGIAIWPVGPLVVIYLAFRLHMNKIATAICLCACVWPALSGWGARIGELVFRNSVSPGTEAFLGAHILALMIAVPAATAVYLTRR